MEVLELGCPCLSQARNLIINISPGVPNVSVICHHFYVIISYTLFIHYEYVSVVI